MRLQQPFSDDAIRRDQSMEGLRRVVVGSAVGSLLGAAAFFAVDVLISTSAEAVPTHLTCKDTTSTWNSSPYTLFTRQVILDFDTNSATVDGNERHFNVTPAELTIHEQGRNKNGTRTSYIFKVDRSTLKYNHEYEFISSGSKFRSNGQCQITKATTAHKS
ncbi:hypothetical protein [Synechococcus sp. UW179A]|uniref:hypothetical protein n=1 Tax=Synechococcus sp. UW179A TaxID=2575510 RepID=UPI0010BE7B85|nr:hypothetical protein [Synechococcus sp. UW179A]